MEEKESFAIISAKQETAGDSELYERFIVGAQYYCDISRDDVLDIITKELEKKPLVQVYSAFAGGGLYKMKTIISSKATYCGVAEEHYNKLICEHVPFHSTLCLEGFKLFINRHFLIR